MRRAFGLVLALTLLWPTVGAASVSGAFAAAAVDVPPGSFLSSGLHAAFLNQTETLREVELIAPVVSVHREELRLVETRTLTRNGVSLNRSTATFVLHDVTLRLSPGVHDGWLGVYASAKTRVDLESASGFGAAPVGSSKLGNLVSVDAGSPDPTLQGFSHQTSVPHFRVDSAGRVTFTGPAALKLEGPDLAWSARENSSILRTGISRDDGVAFGERVEVWVTLSFSEGALALNTTEPGRFQLAVGGMDIGLDGDVRLVDAVGELSSLVGRYVAAGGDVWLDGAFTLRIEPMRPSSAGGVSAFVEGDLRSTSMIRQVVLPAGANGSGAALGVLVVLAVAMGAGGFLVARRRRRAATPLDPDAFVTFAYSAFEAGRFGEGLAWIRRALDHAPHSSRLRSAEGFALAELGDVDGALRAYAEASRLATDGEADFEAARLLRASGGSIKNSDELLVRALERSPWLVLELEDEAAAWGNLGADALRAVRRARRELDK